MKWEAQGKKRGSKTTPCSVSRASFGMAVLFGMHGSAVLQIKYITPSIRPIKKRTFFSMFNTQIFHFIGGSSALDTPILLLSTWHAIRHLVSGVLWNYRKLDCLSNQCPLR